MPKHELTPEMLERIASRFKALSEPARLRILSTLQKGERTVGALVDETGLGQANVSKHLRMLHDLGFVTRRKVGLHAYYRIADADVFALCDLMCGRVEREIERDRAVLGA